MPKTEAELRANKKYLKKFDSILIRIKPEDKEMIVAHAKEKNESVNAFVLRAIEETIKREK